MARKSKVIETPIEKIIEQAEFAQVGPDVYSNHVQISAGIHEFTLDFYSIGPGIGKKPQTFRLSQRVAIPLSIVKGLITALENVVEVYEKDTGITLPNLKTNPIVIKTDNQDE